jgi:hypothetical protein
MRQRRSAGRARDSVGTEIRRLDFCGRISDRVLCGDIVVRQRRFGRVGSHVAAVDGQVDNRVLCRALVVCQGRLVRVGCEDRFA